MLFFTIFAGFSHFIEDFCYFSCNVLPLMNISIKQKGKMCPLIAVRADVLTNVVVPNWDKGFHTKH